MFKKYLTAIATAVALCSTAHAAINNAGFEDGTTAGTWAGDPYLTAEPSVTGLLTLVNRSGTTVVLDLDATPILPVDGKWFGLFLPPDGDDKTTGVCGTGTCSNGFTLFSANTTGGGTTQAGEYVSLRLITGDYAGNVGSTFNDTVQVRFSNGTTYSINSANMSSIDSGWISFAAPVGATGFSVNVVDFYGNGIANSPIVAIDYGVTAVPEPASVLMMLAGLGALGFKGRRATSVKRSAAVAA